MHSARNAEYGLRRGIRSLSICRRSSKGGGPGRRRVSVDIVVCTRKSTENIGQNAHALKFNRSHPW